MRVSSLCSQTATRSSDLPFNGLYPRNPCNYITINCNYSFTDPKGMEGWVGLVGWPIADTLPTKWSHVDQRSGKVRQPKTYVLTTEPCCRLKRWVFRRFIKTARDSADVTFLWRVFHSLEAATGKPRSPIVVVAPKLEWHWWYCCLAVYTALKFSIWFRLSDIIFERGCGLCVSAWVSERSLIRFPTQFK